MWNMFYKPSNKVVRVLKTDSFLLESACLALLFFFLFFFFFFLTLLFLCYPKELDVFDDK